MTIRFILWGCVAWFACGGLSIGRTQDSLEKLEQGIVAELPPPPHAGPVAKPMIEGRPTLGISVDDVSDFWRQHFGITTDRGAVITRIHEGSPAAKVGLPRGGVIVSVNGKRISSANDIIAVIQAFRPGDEVELIYFEGDRSRRKKIRLVPAAPPAPAGMGPPPPNGGAVSRDDPPLRLGRRKFGGRPFLDALERTLDVILPAITEPGGMAGPTSDDALTPPPPPAADFGDAAVPAAADELPVPPPPPPMNLDPPSDPGDPFPPARARDRDIVPPPPPLPGKKPLPKITPGKTDPQSVLVPPAESGNADAKTDAELNALREQMKTLRVQMEELQKKIDELEKKNRSR